MAVASPCINLCRMSPQTGLCEGCSRSLDEITRWSRADEDERLRILKRVGERRSAQGATTLTAETRHE